VWFGKKRPLQDIADLHFHPLILLLLLFVICYGALPIAIPFWQYPGTGSLKNSL
jgi:hypothetical protein